MKKEYLLLLLPMGVVCILLLSLFNFFSIFNNKGGMSAIPPVTIFSPSPSEAPIPLPSGAQGLTEDTNPIYISNSLKTAASTQPFYDKGLALYQLSQKLPYQGKNFILTYDSITNHFRVIVNKNNKDAGQVEFDQYLKDNGVDKSMMTLDVEYD